MDHTQFKISIDVAAQKVIHQLTISNEELENQLKVAIEKALSNFDFETEVEKLADNAIRSALRESMDYGKLKELIKMRSEVILEKFVDQQFEAYRKQQGL